MRRDRMFWLAAVVLASAVAGCARSGQFKHEQNYYREDSAFSDRKGKATTRAEKFGQPKRKIYVLPFHNSTPLGGEDLGTFAADEFLRELRVTGKAIVPQDIKAGSTSQDFYSGGKVRLGALLREGKNMGVALLVIGRIKKITYRRKGDEVGLLRQKSSVAAVDLEMRIFDVSEGKEVLLSEKSADSMTSQLNLFRAEETDVTGERQELVYQAIRNGIRLFSRDTNRALDKINWQGRIAKITAGKVFVNAGRASGLSIGDILKVLTPGEDIYDPVTNAYMGRSPGQTKGTLEVVDYLGQDGAVATIHSGGGFIENDVVQLY